jgi:hypothetical protein
MFEKCPSPIREIIKDEMGRACNVQGRDEKYIHFS